MPSSDPDSLYVALQVAYDLAPKRVLDLGAGYGKYGVLFREYLELRHARGSHHWATGEGKISREVRIDAVEGCPSYVGDLHGIVYDNIYIENIVDFMDKSWEYDFVFFGDVLEHLDKSIAMTKVLPTLVARATMGVLIVVPWCVEAQEEVFGNPLEIHRSTWSARDFRSLAPYVHVGRKDSKLIAFLTCNSESYRQVRGNPLRRKLGIFKKALFDSW